MTDFKKPAVPKKDEKPIHGLVSDKDFIVANAVENILAGKFIFKEAVTGSNIISISKRLFQPRSLMQTTTRIT